MSKLSAHIIVILTAPLFLFWGMAIMGSEGLLFVGCFGPERAARITTIWLAIDIIPPLFYYFIRHPIEKAYRIVIEHWQQWDSNQVIKWK